MPTGPASFNKYWLHQNCSTSGSLCGVCEHLFQTPKLCSPGNKWLSNTEKTFVQNTVFSDMLLAWYLFRRNRKLHADFKAMFAQGSSTQPLQSSLLCLTLECISYSFLSSIFTGIQLYSQALPYHNRLIFLLHCTNMSLELCLKMPSTFLQTWNFSGGALLHATSSYPVHFQYNLRVWPLKSPHCRLEWKIGKERKIYVYQYYTWKENGWSKQ
jgi:hypothetical protein